MSEQTDIAELFSRDPLQLTSPDIEAIIVEMRKRRAAYNLQPQKAPASSKPKKAAATGSGKDLLGDLGL